MMNTLFDLQLFAGDSAAEIPEAGNEREAGAEQEAPEEKKAEPKYTDADIDRIIGQKFAEWQKKQDKKVSEAERLGKMTAEEKTAERIKTLEDKLHGYETEAARAEMCKQARAMLQDKNVHVDDALVVNLIAEDAEGTKAAVDSFLSAFTSAVERAVKEALKGEPPRAGGDAGHLTKAQILAVKNRAERQRLISENMNLFR